MKKIDSLIVLSLFILSACNEPVKGKSAEQPDSHPKQVSEIITNPVEKERKNEGVRFEDSEAGILKANFEIRVRGQEEIDAVNLQGKDIRIEDQIAFDQNNPIFNLRAVSQQEDDLIQEIIQDTNDETLEKEKQLLTNIDKGIDTIFDRVINPIGSIFNIDFGKSERDFLKLYSSHDGPKNFFKDMMIAIQEGNRSEFVSQLADLATYFDQNHIRQREDFIATFSHLFVTLQFPSEGCRQMYFNAILRSGEISIISRQGESV